MKKIFFILSLFAIIVTGSAFAQTAAPIRVLMSTSMGDVELELYPAQAPHTVQNFLDYVNSGFYNDLIFHRVINGFMIQGGGFDADMREKETKAPIQNEADNGLKNDRGTIAMARTNDPHSATSQFFINQKNNPFLNYKAKTTAGWGYAVFGKVVKGMDVVDKIASVRTGTKGFFEDVPIQNVVIKSIKVLNNGTTNQKGTGNQTGGK